MIIFLCVIIFLILAYLPAHADKWYLYGHTVVRWYDSEIWYNPDFTLHVRKGNCHEITMSGHASKFVIKKLLKEGFDIPKRDR